VRTFQINQLFNASMTPLQTLAMVVSQHRGAGAPLVAGPGAGRAVAERCARQLLEQFISGRDAPANRAPGLRQAPAAGDRHRPGLRARVLLLDEPVAGVPAGEREELLQTVAALPADVSVLLIEHDMDLVFRLCQGASRCW
jgi:branched-chain amino acid transport system ATP-binding protein